MFLLPFLEGSPVFILLAPSSPTNVADFIVAFIVDAVKGMMERRTAANRV